MTWDPGNRNLSQDRQLKGALERSHQYWNWSIRVDGSRWINQEQKDKTKLSEGLTFESWMDTFYRAIGGCRKLKIQAWRKLRKKSPGKRNGKYNYRTPRGSTVNNVCVVITMKATESGCNQKYLKIIYWGDEEGGNMCVKGNIWHLNLYFPGPYVNISKNDKLKS